MKRFYFTLTHSEIVQADTEAQARRELADIYSVDAGDFVLESVDDL